MVGDTGIDTADYSGSTNAVSVTTDNNANDQPDGDYRVGQGSYEDRMSPVVLDAAAAAGQRGRARAARRR